MKMKHKWLWIVVMTLCLSFALTATAYATGDVAGAVEKTWTDASGQIKTVVNKVVFPCIDLILAVFFFGKMGLAYFDYRKHGQFEWTGPAILFACLVFSLTAPTYIWAIIGI
ncbi:MAG: DUF3852 domain-containing protein [Lachnospiraceae bacterium]|nr:DUF3852 domain-containing protein [Lachnospiraceae bacterium]